MSDRLHVVVGDSLIVLQFPIVDEDGKAVDLTGGQVRIFPYGKTSGDRPTDVAGGNPVRTGVTLTAGTAQITVSSTTGLAVGMRCLNDNVAQGTWIQSIDSGVLLTLNRPPISSASSQSLTFWHGLLCDISLATLGIAKIQGLPAALQPGGLTQEVYEFDLWYRDAAAKEGVSVKDEFDATTPVSG